MADEGGSGIGWFLAGLGLGALVGIVYAPRSGSEVRDYLREAPDRLGRRSQQLKDTMGSWVDRSKDLVDRQKQQVQSAVEAAKQAYRDTVADVPPQNS